MPRSVRDRLAQRAAASFVGRSAELDRLHSLLENEAPIVMLVYGLPGTGKTSLLSAGAAAAAARGSVVVQLDGRMIEPTERGFLHQLGVSMGVPGAPDATALADQLSAQGGRVLLTLDSYELLALVDTWLRQVFVPALGENVRVVLASRTPPSAAWLSTPGWDGLFELVSLGPLAEPDAIELFARLGVDDRRDAQRLNQFTCGQPLAIRLAAAAVSHDPGLTLDESIAHSVTDELVRLYLAEVGDVATREALEAVSVVRRVTIPLLRSLLPAVGPEETIDRLRRVPFVEASRDGLVIHEAVRHAIAANLRATDPLRHRNYRRAAWRELRGDVAGAAAVELWRYTADMLYLIENPVIREAFFPSGEPAFAVEPAVPADRTAIAAIARQHYGSGGDIIALWCDAVPNAFSVVRDARHAVVGFYCMTDSKAVPGELLAIDPVAAAWSRHLDREPVPPRQCVLFLRCWLGTAGGEGPSPVQAACWLDIKRSYMQLRPQLRRVYLAVQEFEAFGPVATRLGFKPVPESFVVIDDSAYNSVYLDFGPASVDGWLADLVAAELGMESADLLDVGSRELIAAGRRVPLTRLEFRVLRYLMAREGQVATRIALLEDVWGYDYEGGSNVVDVVIRSLRKKLGERAWYIQTVSGAGYRFRREAA